MKTRLVIATCLYVLTFASIVFVFAEIGMYCKQSFEGQNVPVVCANTAADSSSLTKIVYALGGWVLLLGLPTLVAVLYVRFGWPRAVKRTDT